MCDETILKHKGAYGKVVVRGQKCQILNLGHAQRIISHGRGSTMT